VGELLVETTHLPRRTPDVLRALLVGLPDSWADTPDVAGGWRPRDVVGHLISGHPALGEVTLRERLATWAVHDLDHTAQAYAVLAGSRDADVGPWRVYLGILLRREDPAPVPG
jgi:hypothetical protein